MPGAYPVLFTISEEGRARAVARYVNDERSLLMDGYMVASDKEKLAGRPFVTTGSRDAAAGASTW